MRRNKLSLNSLVLLAFLLLSLPCYMVYAGFTGKYTAGMALPDLSFQGLTSPQDHECRGVKGKEAFTPSQISAKMIFTDVLSAIWSTCHKAPL